jgi:hypothetical protein
VPTTTQERRGGPAARPRPRNRPRSWPAVLAWALFALLLLAFAATLAVAAVFQPARRLDPAAVDRRFNRRRHDAARIIEGFGGRLREEVDLDTLTAELLAVVDQTMQPTRAWLWQRPPTAPAGR